MDAKMRRDKDFVDELLESGWKRSEEDRNVLVDPNGEGLTIWVNPHTYKALLSVELQDRLREMIRKSATDA